MINNLTQYLILDLNGIIIESDNHLFDYQNLPEKNALTTFLFLESIFPHLLKLPINSNITFPVIDNNFPWLKGYYDYEFKKIEQEGNLFIKWTIIDRTAHYKDRKRIMQDFNNKQIFSEKEISSPDKGSQKTD